MATISTGQHSLFRTATAWEQVQAWNTKRGANISRFIEDSELTRASFFDAWSSNIEGAKKLTVQIFSQRIAADAKAKMNAAASGTEATASIKSLPTVFFTDTSKIDLAAGRITLADGRVLDIQTGVEVDLSV